MSYAKVLVGWLDSNKSMEGIHGQQQGFTSGYGVDSDWKGLSFSVPSEDRESLVGCYMVTLYASEELSNLEKWLQEEGFFPIYVMPLGGKLIFLSVNENGEFFFSCIARSF